MPEFKREERYIVVKIKSLDHTQMSQLCAALDQNGIDTVECVVVEADWPIYEQVRDAVQRLAEGRSQRVEELAAHIQATYDLLVEDGDGVGIKDCQELLDVVNSTPAANLDRLIAEKQAEVLTEIMALVGAGATFEETIDAMDAAVKDLERIHAEAKGGSDD